LNYFTLPYRNYRAENIDPLLEEPMNVWAYEELVKMPEGAELPALFYNILMIGDNLHQFVRVKLPHLTEKQKASKDAFGDNFRRIPPLPALFYHVLLMGDDLNKFVRVKLPHMSEKLKASKGGFGDNFWRITNHTEKYFKYRPVCIRKKQFQLLFMQKIFS
jgi:hypothetical protein